MNLNQITMPVNDMKKAVAFYQTLGFILIVDTPHYTRFECPKGNSTFSLSLETSEFYNGTVVYFEHENLDNWVDDLKSKGLAFDQEPEDKPYLWKEAILHDPSGNKIKLFWAGENRLNPPWRVSDDKGISNDK